MQEHPTMTINTICHQLNRGYHTAIAQGLRSNTKLLEKARRVTSAWRYNNPYPVSFVKERTTLLDEPVSSIRNTLVRRYGNVERLRGVSPFAILPATVWSKTQVEQLWRLVAHHAMRVVEHFEYPLHATPILERPQNRLGFTGDQTIVVSGRVLLRAQNAAILDSRRAKGLQLDKQGSGECWPSGQPCARTIGKSETMEESA